MDIDNGPPGIISDSGDLGPEPAEIRERVDAGRVATFKCDLQGVLTDERDVPDEQLFRAQSLDPRESPWCTRFAATFSAGTRPSQLLAGVRAVPAVFPRDLHCLARTINVDVDRKRIGVLRGPRLVDVDDRQLAERLDRRTRSDL